MIAKIISCLIISMGFMSMDAQEIDTRRMDDFLEHLHAHDKVMGSLAVMQGDSLVYTGAMGMGNIDKQYEATVDTRYKIGSISKTFTAVILMRLVEEERVALSTTLDRYHPQITNADQISLEMLLRHRSGIPEYLLHISEGELSAPVSREAMLQKIYDMESDFDPDSKYVYSNSNYYLLADILEKVSGESYESLISDLVTPLKLSSTWSGQTELSEKDAVSYMNVGSWVPAAKWHMSWALGAGDVSSTASEVCRFMYALQTGQIVGETTLTDMNEMVDGYGYGVFSIPYGDARGYGHNGGIENFRSCSYHFPDLDLTLGLLINANDMVFNDILIGILAIATGADYVFPDFKEKEVVVLPREKLVPFEGNYVSETFPLDIKVFLEEDTLMAQATGQGPFALSAVGDNEFVFTLAGIEMSFDQESKSLTLKQAGMTNTFVKE